MEIDLKALALLPFDLQAEIAENLYRKDWNAKRDRRDPAPLRRNPQGAGEGAAGCQDQQTFRKVTGRFQG
jgi:hypothetical protein